MVSLFSGFPSNQNEDKTHYVLVCLSSDEFPNISPINCYFCLVTDEGNHFSLKKHHRIIDIGKDLLVQLSCAPISRIRQTGQARSIYHCDVAVTQHNLSDFPHLFLQVVGPHLTDHLAVLRQGCWHPAGPRAQPAPPAFRWQRTAASRAI